MKKILSTLLFAGIGVSVAAAIDDDFRESLIDGAKNLKDSVKDKFFSEPEVDPEEDEEPEEPTETVDELGPDDPTVTPEDLEKAHEDMNNAIEALAENSENLDDLPKEDIQFSKDVN